MNDILPQLDLVVFDEDALRVAAKNVTGINRLRL